MLKLGGPANNVPLVRLRRSYSPLKAVSPPKEPEALAGDEEPGALAGGSFDHGS